MLFPLLSKTSPLCPNACHAVRIVKKTATPIRLIIVFDVPQPWNVASSYEDYISPSFHAPKLEQILHLVGRAIEPAACFQQALRRSQQGSRPDGGCRLIARPTIDQH